MLTVGSLFSGIGGLDLGLERAGMKVIWQCEIDEYASKVLKKHWPEVPNLGDITKVDWNDVERPDLLCGGFPCQDISIAGKGAGLEGTRSGLWWEFHKAISVLRPRYIIVENVPMLTHRGLDRVLASLSEIGYDAEWNIVSARFVGANHRRDRIIIVAHAGHIFRRDCGPGAVGCNGDRELDTSFGAEKTVTPSGPSERTKIVAHNDCFRCDREQSNTRADRESISDNRKGIWSAGDCEIKRICKTLAHSEGNLSGHGNNGNVSIFWHGKEEWERGSAIQSREWWAVEPDVGRVADGVSRRMDRLRCLGNAVVPQVAEFVGTCILKVEEDW